ncbi:Chromatin structure remodeling complex protein sfh1 [Orbilia blumenaviensis]|uniref:Chromatin structure remodeling complex protein sfh1 n=1 Tax=Orbilia blumenaviensis TaxID=1796055 RepID=A0AAV9U778_9PEZI
MSTPVPHLSRSNSAVRGASSTPAPQTNGNGVPPPTAPAAGAPESSALYKIQPQAYTTNYATRIKGSFQTMLVVPAVQASTSTLPPRSARRGQANVNYAEREDDDDDYGGGESRRGAAATPIVPEEITEPVTVAGKYPPKPLPWRRTLEQTTGAAELPEVLIPIIFEKDIDSTRKIRERFTWNLFEGDITPERFARQLCADLELDPRLIVDDLVTAIRTACQEWAPIACLPLPEKFVDPISGDEGFYLVPIKLNVQCGVDTLTDQFMYNLFEEQITPEHWASVFCNDIGYSGEFRGAVTTAIREELLKAKKEMFFPSGTLTHYNWKADGHPQFPGIRYDPENYGSQWSPNIDKLTRDEVERKEIDRERETRRLRRENIKLNPVNAAQVWLYGTNGIPTPDMPATPGGSITDTFSRRKRQPMVRDRDDSPMRKGSIGGQGGSSTPAQLASTAVPLPDTMIMQWKCSHCNINGMNTWGVRDGPTGKYTLCAICGYLYYEQRVLPEWRRAMYENDLGEPELVVAGGGGGYEMGGVQVG